MENDRFILNRNSDVKVIYIGTGQFQLASGKWVDAILYKDHGVYKMMEASEFIELAEPDRSTTLDHVGDIIGHYECSPDRKNDPYGGLSVGTIADYRRYLTEKFQEESLKA